MSNSTFDRKTALEFILSVQSKMFGLDGYIELRTFSDKVRDGIAGNYWIPVSGSVSDVSKALDWAEGESTQGRGVFISYNLRSEKKGSKDSIKQLVASYQDLDVYLSTGQNLR
jgi:predicted heme/steroid binding protein